MPHCPSVLPRMTDSICPTAAWPNSPPRYTASSVPPLDAAFLKESRIVSQKTPAPRGYHCLGIVQTEPVQIVSCRGTDRSSACLKYSLSSSDFTQFILSPSYCPLLYSGAMTTSEEVSGDGCINHVQHHTAPGRVRGIYKSRHGPARRHSSCLSRNRECRINVPQDSRC